ncbi:frigida-LIKE protein [Medicago truncatula]|uniref:FRIGIDA-like protein n=1 Tax=Medicago truncatula TaxID=3880 RepID=G7LE62_MEDTR|nr:frigida-LIKE protein [Medicago truncatula]
MQLINHGSWMLQRSLQLRIFYDLQFCQFVKDSLEVLQLKENQFEVQIKDLESKLNNLDGQIKELELTKKQYDEEKEFVKCRFNILENIEGHLIALLANYFFRDSDKIQHILDRTQDPQPVIISERHIYLLEQLMRILPSIKPCVREEAFKLALELKANVKGNTEKSLNVLGFLLILSIHVLLTSFDKDEVLELFVSVVQHKISVANEVSGILI